MCKLSDTIERKFIETFDVSEWQVETENGFVDVISSNKTINYEIYKIELENGLFLECADTHILIDENHQEVFAKDSLGISLITKQGLSKVVSVIPTGIFENMYDLSIDSEEHTYFTNDILSHNTTSAAAYILWYTVFQESKSVAILANKSSTAREIMSRYQLMYEYLPLWMQQGIKTWNKGDVELENGSKVYTAATTVSGIRGKSVNMLYIDEASIIPNNIADAFFTAVYPVISAGTTTKILITSTPLGYNHFWKFWNDALNKRNDFVPMFIPYWEIPGRDENWAEEQRRQLGEVKFNQEVLCKFLGSALTLIRSDIIEQLSFNNPEYSRDGLDVYSFAEPKRNYVIIVDTAQGVGGDYSAFTVIDVTEVPYRLVAKYRDNNISPLLYPSVIYRVAKEYNNAYILTEVNFSEQVANILYHEYEYENILFVQRDSTGQRISGGFGGAGRTQLGVVTDKKIKRIGCLNFKSMIEEKKLLIPDADIISEISTFIEIKDSYAADEGYHDDLVMTLVLFGWLTTNPYFKELTDINLREIIFKKRIQQIEDEMLPIGFINDGQQEEVFIEGNDVWSSYNQSEKTIPMGYLSSRM